MSHRSLDFDCIFVPNCRILPRSRGNFSNLVTPTLFWFSISSSLSLCSLASPYYFPLPLLSQRSSFSLILLFPYYFPFLWFFFSLRFSNLSPHSVSFIQTMPAVSATESDYFPSFKKAYAISSSFCLFLLFFNAIFLFSNPFSLVVSDSAQDVCWSDD